MSSVSSLGSLLSSALMGSSASSTSAMDISSLLQAATGSSSTGIDVTSAVDAALYADRAPERQWQAQQSTIASQISALTSLQSALSAVSQDLDDLNNIDGSLAARTVSSSSAQVTGTATAGATTGTHSVSVSNLATSSSWYSGPMSSATASLGTSTLTITSSDGSQTPFTAGSGVNSLSDLANAINSSSLGINASIVTDATGARLALVSSTTGSAADFSVSYSVSGSGSSSGVSFTRAGTAANASLTVDGIPVSSATNTVSGVIPGLTLNLTGATPANDPATVTIGADTTQITQTLSTFISDYNTALSQVNSQFNYSTSSGSQGVLSGDSIVRSLQGMLEQVVSYSAPAGSTSGTTPAQSLANLGITVNDDGSLSLNTATVDSEMANPGAVQNFFQGSALNGFAQQFSTQLNQFADPSTGSIAEEISNLNQQYSSLQSQVNDYESGYIASQQTVLTAMYSKAEIALEQLPTEMQEIQQQLGNNNSSGS